MTAGLTKLRPWVHDLRPRAVDRDGVLVFRELPLYLALMALLDDREDRPETEPEVFAFLGGDLQLRELVSIDWWDAERGPTSLSLIIAHTPDEGLLVLGGEGELVTIALGPERALQAVAADVPHLVLPRLAARGAVIREVAVRYTVCWTMDDLRGIVTALIGVEPREQMILRDDLLMVVHSD